MPPKAAAVVNPKQGGGRSPSQRSKKTGLTAADDVKTITLLTERNWLGEVSLTRVSERKGNVDTDIFPGARLIEEYARSFVRKFLVVGLRIPHQKMGQAVVETMASAKCCRDLQLINDWAGYVVEVERNGRQKTSLSYWASSLYNERSEEHLRLKQSLDHPSHHFTLSALQKSWTGARSTMGPFGEIEGTKLLHLPGAESSVFGIRFAA